MAECYCVLLLYSLTLTEQNEALKLCTLPLNFRYRKKSPLTTLPLNQKKFSPPRYAKNLKKLRPIHFSIIVNPKHTGKRAVVCTLAAADNTAAIQE